MSEIQQQFIQQNIQKKYEEAYLLNVFSAICDSMKFDNEFRKKVMKLRRESSDFTSVMQQIVKKEFQIDLPETEMNLICIWIGANLTKNDTRKDIPIETKRSLFKIQSGKCAICGCSLGSDMNKIHVDHIIPWDYVGDQLPDNYQDLCEKCNLEKGKNPIYPLLFELGLTKPRRI